MFLSSQADDLDIAFTDPLLQPYCNGTTGSPSPEEMKGKLGQPYPRKRRTNDVDTHY